SINTEMLASSIQKKQAELRQFVFRNMVIRNFNSYNHKTHLKNFATYQYIYNVMETITSGKNKSVITKCIIESTAEFAYLHGDVLYIQHAYKLEGEPMQAGGYTVGGGWLKPPWRRQRMLMNAISSKTTPRSKTTTTSSIYATKYLKKTRRLHQTLNFPVLNKAMRWAFGITMTTSMSWPVNKKPRTAKSIKLFTKM